jgi:peptidoglycan/LPS O-acetylase OafA/YrhL
LPQFLGYTWINEIFWTLAIEFQFYLFIAIAFVGFNHQKWWIKAVTVLLFVVPYFFYTDNRYLTSYSSLFLLGVVAFWYRVGHINNVRYVVFTILLACWAYYQFPLNNISIPLVSTITSFVIAFANINSYLGNHAGKVSYSLYLTHGLVGGNFLFFSMYIALVKDNDWARMALIFVALFLSLIFAWVFYQLVEKPSQKLSKKITI